MRLPPDALFIDGFAGGGGASTGIAQAIGRNVDIAVNHNASAIAIHKANHPDTQHYCCDIRTPFLPRTATRMRPVAGAWFSPDCKEYSKAKGGPVKDRHIRALSNEVTVWLKETMPTVFYLENVEEYEYAAPLDENGIPVKELAGQDFKRLKRTWQVLGYRIEHRKLRACDYGAPTSRRRLYVIGRRDGLPIVWPKPTHGPRDSAAVQAGELLPYRTAAECIDWSIPCPSIFDRARPLKDATMRRIAHGVMRYVVNAAEPFIVPVTHSQNSPRVHPTSEPLRTITTANGGEFALADVIVAPHVMTNRNSAKPFSAADEPTHTVTAGGAHQNLVGATMVQMGYGERAGQEPRALDIDEPLGTIVAGGGKHGAVTAFMSRFYGSDKVNGGGEPEQPLSTVRAGGQHHAVVCAHIEQANGGPRNVNAAGSDARRPLSTVTTTGSQQRVVETTMIEEGALPPDMIERAVKVAAFLVKYYGTNGENETAQSQAVDRPLDAITTKARFAVVTVTIDAVTYVIVDIGLRMLKPRELARAQGFPDDYVLDPIVPKIVRGKLVHKPLTIAEQISAIGNSVCPPVARALVAANQPQLQEIRRAA